MATAADAVKEFNKNKVGSKVVTVNGEAVRGVIRSHFGVDVLFVDGSQQRFAATDDVKVATKESEVGRDDALIVSSPLGARVVDTRVEDDNEKSLEDAKKFANSGTKAAKKATKTEATPVVPMGAGPVKADGEPAYKV